jgi:hypothetical protein
MSAPDPRWRAAMTVPVIAAVAFLCVQTTQVDRLDDGLAELRSDITAVIAQVETQRPYSCRLLDDEQRKCAFGSCDARIIERLKRECLRDGGTP